MSRHWFWIALLVYASTIVLKNPGDLHEHLFQAYAWLHGHAYVDGLPIHETAQWQGHQYVLHPPLATLVDLPYVLFFGPLLPQSIISVVIAAYTVALASRLLKSNWLTAFFAFGTTFWYEATLGAAWGFCATLSTLPSMACLLELEKPDGSSGVRLGAFAGLAALARYDLVAVWPVYLLWFQSKLNRPKAAHFPHYNGMAGMISMLAVSFLIYATHAWAKYGVPYDKGLQLWYERDVLSQVAYYGPFSIHYLPFNLYTSLFMAPAFTRDFPWVVPTVAGQALVLTSPALLLVLGADYRERRNQYLLTATVLSMSGCLLVWSNGTEQFGCRYWIQALPFLCLLMRDALLPIGSGRLAHRLIVVSVVLQAWGVSVIRLWGFA